MGWQVLTGFKMGGSKALKKAVCLSGTANTRSAARLCLTIRPNLIEGGEVWVPGQAIEAALGASDHAGLLRLALSRDGQFQLSPIGRTSKGAVCLRLPWPEGVTPSKRPSVPLSFEPTLFGGVLALLVRLPDWARPPVSERSGLELPVPAPAAAPRTRSGYVSPSDRLPDPAAADRLAAKQGGEIRA